MVLATTTAIAANVCAIWLQPKNKTRSKLQTAVSGKFIQSVTLSFIERKGDEGEFAALNDLQ